MADLVAFLRARLDEERALADRAAAHVRDNPSWGNDWVGGMTGGLGGPGGDLGAIFSPDRVMADVQAKRAILDEFERLDAIPPPNRLMVVGARTALRLAVQQLAVVYQDHPDYRFEEWRP